MIIRNKINDLLIDSLRAICLVILIFLIAYHNWNNNASIIFGLIAVITIVFSVKTFTIIDSNGITIIRKRLLTSLSKTDFYNKNDISNIEYNPSKTYPLIVILPGVGGYKSAKIKITLTNGKYFEHMINMKKNDFESIKQKLNIK